MSKLRNIVLLVIAVSAIFAVAGCAGPSVEFAYQNPNSQLEFRDTQIIPDNGRFYSVGTFPPYWGGPNAGVKLYVSDDLANWKFETLIIDAAALDKDVWYKDRFWAPELRKINGKYYVTFNCQNNSGGYGDVAKMKHHHGCGLAVSDEITGPYKVLTHEKPLAEFPSNDLHLFQDDDGKTYAFFNNGWTNIHKIFVAEIDLEKGKLIEEPVELIKQESGWDGSGIEGAHVIKQDGIYYLFYSSWTKGYAVGYATAKNIRGPWTKSNDNPIFGAYSKDGKNYIFKNGKELQVDQSPYVTLGHNQIFKGPDGNFWTSCHAYTDAGKAWMIMDPIWFEDGKVKTNAPTFTPQTVPVDKKFLKMFPGLKVK